MVISISFKKLCNPCFSKIFISVMRNSRVLSIITEDARAVGVTYSRFGEEASVRCTREVIVAAGTVNSAKLLMLSGIGPREELDRVGIKVVADLPVGQNLQVTFILPQVISGS